MKLNIRHVADTRMLIKLSILALENQMAHRTEGDVLDRLQKAQLNLMSARNALEAILNMDVEGRQWT